MARVEGADKVVAALKKRGLKWLAESANAAPNDKRVNPSVIVGYTQHYALWVHQNLEVHHPVGQAMYLIQPARQFEAELGRIAVKAVRNGATIAQALILAGLRLQRESQLLVPVDTGALKASAFTKLE